MKVYFISGLGADKRVFKNIHLNNNFQPEYLDWIQPNKSETLKEYSLRLALKINFAEPFALVGLSMGGMVAVEIAKQYKVKKLILLSSVPTSNELPLLYKLSSRFKFHKMLPTILFKSASVLKWVFITDTNENKKLMRQIIIDSDTYFVKWALNAIVSWKNDEVPEKLFHIHGDDDFLLPLKNTSATHVVKGGSNMMVLNQAQKISFIINDILIK
ncbi:MAG: alpha/beta hydrolase [Ferruginibacter sp.]